MRLQIVWKNGWAHAHGTAPDGARVRRALGTRDPDRAEEARAHLEARLWKVGLYGAGAVVTFDECALAYAKNGGETRFLEKVAKALVGRQLQGITPEDIRDLSVAHYPKGSAATRNRQFIAPASAVINYGHQRGWCGPIKVARFTEAKRRKTSVGREYLDKLQPHLPAPLYAMMMTMQTTGRRVGDMLALTVQDVDLRRGVIRIGDPKNGEPATAWLTAEVAGLLAAIMPETGRVFPYAARGSIYSTLRRACKKAGVEYLGTHQPGRHSFATKLDDAGFSTAAIAEAGGWKSPALVAKTYIHPNQAGQRAAAVFGKKLARPKKGA